MHDAADHPAIVNPFHIAHIGRQVRLDPSPLFVAQPKQISAPDPDPLSKNESGSYCQSSKVNEF
jgi:hypothetical protein